ncbi:MAG: hypothetical protein DMG15_02035 [Acidobacteria bacterium]|nr:MAG: hypothetical protein DMG15_02035 [Acidobacteriota bacterium]
MRIFVYLDDLRHKRHTHRAYVARNLPTAGRGKDQCGGVLSSIGQGFMQLEEELMRLLVSEFNGLPEPEGDFIAGEFGHIQ